MLPRFFIDRPIFAWVIALSILLAGALTPATAAETGPTAPVTPGERSPLSTYYVAPTRIVWQSAAGAKNAESLLRPHAGQAVLQEPLPPCILNASAGQPAGVLLDFGRA